MIEIYRFSDLAWKLHLPVIKSYSCFFTEHYAFPEDPVPENQDEVRTIEEESLFRAAYPELVESFQREKAMAKENKTKSKFKKYFLSLPFSNKINSTMKLVLIPLF